MSYHSQKNRKMECNKGSVAVIVGICIIALVGFAALAIDVSHLFMVRGELQNAADAGALAGAQVLFSVGATEITINTEANTTAWQVARSHLSDSKTVDVALNEVQRGHWCFSCIDPDTDKKGVFTPNPSTAVIDLVGKTTEYLDTDPTFINAVRVYARRSDTPAPSFFARIFGFQDFLVSAHAVAYIGFAGKLLPGEVDAPIAICAQSIWGYGTEIWTCNTGKMINSGSKLGTSNTAAWTDFAQPCGGATSGNDLKKIIGTPPSCGVGGNPYEINLGEPMSATGGQDTGPGLFALMDCWISKTNKQKVMPVTLPVINCPGNNTTSCTTPVGAVEINILWITGNNPRLDDAPTKMYDAKGETLLWENSSTDGQVRWNSFVTKFQLQDADGAPAAYGDKNIYFIPECKPMELKGVTGGQNFGVRAKIPVLVQ
jgi:hypothetical protein